MGTLTTLRPSEVMIDSSAMISGRLSLIASLILALWRAWSTGPLRCSDQSCLETEMVGFMAVPDHSLCSSG